MNSSLRSSAERQSTSFAGRLELAAEHLQQRLLEARHVGAALGGGDDVDERADPGVVARAPADGDVHP
ncbi:MAG TPA: hypothetical protein VF821_15630, partial [Lentzea sp.]